MQRVLFLMMALAFALMLWPTNVAWADTRLSMTAPAPFLYRPYYGTETMLSRSVSLFDHDQPWYASDGIFVRYDGQQFKSGSAMNCQPYVSCYDGHNGYDLNMVYEPVLAAGSGTVIRAGWYNPANHSDGFGLWVAIDHGNGYYTAYGHLSAIDVVVGQPVAAQWQIGTSGSSGSATGPHLHFSVFMANKWQPTDPFGWQSSAGTDPNVVPDFYLWVNAPGAPTQAPNLGATGSAAYQGAIVVNDTASAFSATGAWQSATGPGTVSQAMHWASTTAGNPTATATWQPKLGAGYYEIGVYIDAFNASTQWAPYTVTSLDAQGKTQVTTVRVDQAHVGIFQNPFGATVDTGPRWVSLGTYYFPAGTVGKVTLTNGTGEVGQQVGVDAVEFVPVPQWTTAGAKATPTPTNLVPGQHHKP